MSASDANLTWPFLSGWTVAVLAISVVLWVLYLRQSDGKKKSIYGLQHGRLHLDAQVPMWMNMGYWKVRKPPSQFLKAGVLMKHRWRDEFKMREEQRRWRRRVGTC
jgi:hypothetical protein